MSHYKFLTNKRKTNIEFDRYIGMVIIKLSENFIVEKTIYKKDEFRRITGAVIKYKDRTLKKV